MFLQAGFDFPYLAPFLSACTLSFWMMRPMLTHNLDKAVDRAAVYQRKAERVQKLRNLH